MSRIQTVTPSNSTVIDRWTFVATYRSDVLAKTGLEASRSGAHQCLCWRQRIEYGRATSITDLAAREGVTDAYVCRLLRLTCLAPDITTAILDGSEPIGTTVRDLIRPSLIRRRIRAVRRDCPRRGAREQGPRGAG